mmetsp:Transcript_137169/g.293025  ORF Transcript_137169/g.293025 Transcript_137169/m.293025 type:complete len:444 (-) Transcript_137169:57-1388(-)
MSVFGAFLEEDEIREIQNRYPDFDGEVPKEARVWSKTDLELFFKSNGSRRPRETARGGGNSDEPSSCPLLSRLRLKLAEERVEDPPAFYISYCRHRAQRHYFCALPGAAGCGPVQRVREAPAKGLKVPVTIKPRTDADTPAHEWNLQFWAECYGNVLWTACAQAPAYELDKDTTGGLAVEASILDYVEYIRVLQAKDPHCSEDLGLAFPRVQIEGWSPFANVARDLFLKTWQQLNPAGVQDLTARWIEVYTEMFNDVDSVEQLARFYQISIGATGSITRLHVENHEAHVWFLQIEGQKLFFLFPPEDADKVYAEQGGEYVEAPQGYATSVSFVDLFFPNQKKHPRFADAAAQVCLLGEGKTLVVPAGWWWCSIATEPSVTLRHKFWGIENRAGIVEEFWAPYSTKETDLDVREAVRAKFTELREVIREDDGTDAENYVVVDGG